MRELTLLGQNVNAYHGLDARGRAVGLGELCRRLAEIDGLARIRYTTSHPRDMDDDLIAAHRDCRQADALPAPAGAVGLGPHPQGDEPPPHRAPTISRLIERIRDARPDIALSGDFIVGFPGETDADFEETLSIVREVGYASAYSFKYSPRPGTPGADCSTTRSPKR